MLFSGKHEINMLKPRFKILEPVSVPVDNLWYWNRRYWVYHIGNIRNIGMILYGISHIGFH